MAKVTLKNLSDIQRRDPRLAETLRDVEAKLSNQVATGNANGQSISTIQERLVIIGGSAAAAQTSANNANNGVTQQNSPDYLTNADKIALMQAYGAELQTQSVLDNKASTLGITGAVVTDYDNAITAIGTTLTNAGAPSDWATVWPDGKTFGPSTNIQTSLANAWATVAQKRTVLQNTVASTQAFLASQNTSNPNHVSWDYAHKPTLPNGSYPAGYCALTTDGHLVIVSADGNYWHDVTWALQTANYVEDGSGNPTAGAKMDSVGTAVKIGPNGLQVGSTLFGDYLLPRINQALDGGSSAGKVFYRGNIDVTTRGGAPNIACLSVIPPGGILTGGGAVATSVWYVSSNVYFTLLDFLLQPKALNDNLDAMRYAKVVLYSQSAKGSRADLIPIGTWFIPLPDRLYANATDSNAANSCRISHTFQQYNEVQGSSYYGYVACVVTLYNAYGPSAGNCFYTGALWTAGTALTNAGQKWPTGITINGGSSSGSGGGAGGGAGGAGGGLCFTGNVPVDTPDGFKRFDSLPQIFEIMNETGRHFAKLLVRDFDGELVEFAPGMGVTFEHRMRQDGGISARDYFADAPVMRYKGKLYNMHVLSENPDDLHYRLETGDIAHNISPMP